MPLIFFLYVMFLLLVNFYVFFSRPNLITPEDEKEFAELSKSDNKDEYPSFAEVIETLKKVGIEPNYLGGEV